MALEASDINDKAILDSTKMDLNDRGAMQLRVALPSGRVVESEWVPEDKKPEALRVWVETIRNEIQADADEVRAEVRRKAQEEDAARRRAASGIDDTVEVPTIRGVPVKPGPQLVTPKGEPLFYGDAMPSSDPVAFAKQAYALALADLERIKDAQERVDRWYQALVAFGVAPKKEKARRKKRRNKKPAAKSTAGTGETEGEHYT